MNYISSSLVAGERVVYRSRLHWIIFWPAAVLLLLAFLNAPTPAVGTTFVLLLAAAGFGTRGWVTTKYSEIGVTNRRVVIKIGFLTFQSLELLLPKVESVRIEQGFLGCLLGFGTIVVTGTGGTEEKFTRIAFPQEFRRQVQEQVFAFHAP